MYGVLPIATTPIATAPYSSPAAAAFEKCLFLSPALSDAGTITASSSMGALAAANMQNPEPTKKWRGSGTTHTLTIILARPAECSALAMIGHNFSAEAVWRLKGAVDATTFAAGDLLVDTGWQSVWPATGKPLLDSWPHRLCLLRWAAAGAGTYWQVEIVDPDNTAGYVEAGRLMLGVAWQPAYNVDVDPSFGFVPLDVQESTPYGQTFTDPRPWAQRRVALTFSAGNQDDIHDYAMELARLRGQAGDVVFCLDPAEGIRFHQWSLQCLFSGGAEFKAQPMWDGANQVWGFTANLIEKL